MVLTVPFEEFAEIASKRLGVREAFVTSRNGRTLITAGEPAKSTVLATWVDKKPADVRKELMGSGLSVHTGAWSLDLDSAPHEVEIETVYVAGVAYKSAESKPGIWMDAYSEQPNEATVLRSMFEEFCETGEIADVSFEEFVRLANPNVVILTPDQVKDFIRKKTGC